MKLKHDGMRFVCESTYEERAIPKAARFRWDPTDKVWWTADLETAKALIDYADDECAAMFPALVQAKAVAIEASHAIDTTRELPVPAGLTYMGFQRAGIAYAMDHMDCLIADEMGLGKTIQAIGTINALPEVRRVLVIVPASLKLNWQREIGRWSTRGLSVEIAINDFPTADIVIINYDVLKKYYEAIRLVGWDMLICDEAHYLKNPKSQRTQLVFGGGEQKYKRIEAKRRLFLTGTPVLNRPIELHPMLKAMGVEFAKNWYNYVTTYCGGRETKYGWDVTGATNLDALNQKLRETVMMRREKAQVLSELPAKIHQLIPLDPQDYAQELEDEQTIWTSHETKTKEMKKIVARLKREGRSESDEYRDAVKTLREAALTDFAEIARVRHVTALKKVPAAIETILSAAEAGSVVVFAHHRDVIDAITTALSKESVTCAKVTGETNVGERQIIVDEFQAGKIRVFVGSIKACGFGITLTRASHVIFAELDWTPATMAQAEDRCHRIGQKESVLVQHVVVDGSIDAMIAKKLISKEEIIEEILA